VPSNSTSVYESLPNAVLGISICPCVAADGHHLPTAIIFDSKFDFEVTRNYKCRDYRFFFF
jgi:hypothetical protein